MVGQFEHVVVSEVSFQKVPGTQKVQSPLVMFRYSPWMQLRVGAMVGVTVGKADGVLEGDRLGARVG